MVSGKTVGLYETCAVHLRQPPCAVSFLKIKFSVAEHVCQSDLLGDGVAGTKVVGSGFFLFGERERFTAQLLSSGTASSCAWRLII